MENLDQNNKLELPGATSSLVLGILSISMCYCWGTIGLVLSIIGLSSGVKAISAYTANPGVYTEGSFKNANSGKVCSIIGLILSVLSLLTTIFTWSSTIAWIKTLQGLGGFNF
ncbi:MAG: hypothetical protein FWG22_01430 [Prolixibacteraceae bacterium]|nr:hypothetical protein [Prolixibacteraceae bacterium]